MRRPASRSAVPSGVQCNHGLEAQHEAGMHKNITRHLGITIGMDVSDRFTEAYAIDGHGAWAERWRMPTKQGALRDGLSR